MIDSVVSVENVQEYCKIIKEKSNRRKFLKLSSKANDELVSIEDIINELNKIQDETHLQVPERTNIGDLLQDLSSINGPEWWIEELIPKQALLMISGPAGCYKSTLAYCIASHIGCGKEFSGRKTQKAKVLVVDKENSLHVQKMRLQLLFDGTEDVDVWTTLNKTPPPSFNEDG